MAIFGKKKEKPLTSQQQFPPIYNLESNLQGPYGDVPQISTAYVNHQSSSTSQGYGLSQPPPQGWVASLPPYQPIFVTQNYILPVPINHGSSSSAEPVSKVKIGSVTRYLDDEGALDDKLSAWQRQLISAKLDAIITQIDGEVFSGDERELIIHEQPKLRRLGRENSSQGQSQEKSKGIVNNTIPSALTSTNYFAKVNLYANSRLPSNLPPMKL